MWWWLITISAVILALLVGFVCGAAVVAHLDDQLMQRLGVTLPGELPRRKATPPCRPDYESEL